MRITCNGMLVGLSVAGETRDGGDYPILQIWRPTGPTSNDYERISEYTFPIGCTQTNNVRQCTVSPSIDVEVGDIIGIILPRNRQSSAFWIYFASSSSSTSYTLDSTSASTFSVPGSTTASAQSVLTLDIQEQGRSITFDAVPYSHWDHYCWADNTGPNYWADNTGPSYWADNTGPNSWADNTGPNSWADNTGPNYTEPTTQAYPPELTTQTEGPTTQPTHAPTQGRSMYQYIYI